MKGGDRIRTGLKEGWGGDNSRGKGKRNRRMLMMKGRGKGRGAGKGDGIQKGENGDDGGRWHGKDREVRG